MSDSDFELRFGGIGRLFSVQGLERLREAHVCVIGVGGVGSWAVEALARSGIGALTLIDADDVCTTNINRQLPAMSGTVGRPKVTVLAERMAEIAPECRDRDLKVLTCGAAGGRRDGTQARVTDLGLAGQDELLRQVRKRLRREHGWDPGEVRRAHEMGIPCVYSPEKPIFPYADGTCAAEPELGSSLRMDCASGFGAATFVTGVFGFVAAGEIVRQIAEG